MFDLIKPLQKFFTDNCPAKNIGFYDFLVSNMDEYYAKCGYAVQYDCDRISDIFRSKSCEILNDICECAIQYHNKFEKCLVYASIIIEFYHDRIDTEILRKYSNINTTYITFDGFPLCVKIINKYKCNEIPKLIDIVVIMKLYEFADMDVFTYIRKMEKICKVNEFDCSNAADLIETSKNWKDVNGFIRFLIAVEKSNIALEFIRVHIDALNSEIQEWLKGKIKTNKIILYSDDIIMKTFYQT